MFLKIHRLPINYEAVQNKVSDLSKQQKKYEAQNYVTLKNYEYIAVSKSPAAATNTGRRERDSEVPTQRIADTRFLISTNYANFVKPIQFH